MKIESEVARRLLHEFDFKTLFREQLGWDNYSLELPLQLRDAEYHLSGVAQKAPQDSSLARRLRMTLRGIR